MGRIDHIDNPNAPAPNSVVPSTTAFVLDKNSRVLLMRRTDNGDWALPGGAHDAGEYIADTAIRETKEETGIDINIIGIVGIYTNPNHLIEYDDGEVRQQFSLCFRGEPIGGKPTTSTESSSVEWFTEHELAGLSINPSMRLRIQHGFEGRDTPYIG
jgi:ADP-ribose pyrophosphatase YjhB (NUDIX family)